MRTEVIADGGVRVRAIAGTNTVLLAFDVTDEALRGRLLGFAIRRSGPTAADKPFWFEASKVFKSVVPYPEEHQRWSTLEHPIQSLIWGDYSAKPGKNYEYLVRAIVGTPADPQPGAEVSVKVRTERERNGKDGVWFNRGAIASQVFAERYGNKPPQDPENPKDPTTKWLSRGLLEACLDFIDGTEEGEGLLVAAYEFTYKPVLDALKNALERGVKVRIVYDASSKKDPDTGELELTDAARANRTAIGDWKFPKSALFPRKRSGDIPHNKFIVRLDAGEQPVAVWTGSTNFTSSGFLGQSNVGHLVMDGEVAAVFAAYWALLRRDLDRDTMRPEVEALGERFEAQVGDAAVDPPLPKGVSLVFSPRAASRMLNWYAERIDAATNGVMWTGAFGVDAKLGKAMSGADAHPRFLLLEKPPTKKARALFKGSKNLQIAYGNVLGQRYVEDANGELTRREDIPEFELERWFLGEEHFRRKGHVFFVHTKFLLVDPLGDDPLVFSGSANFSSNSLLSNDENMLLIRGNTRVADIYLTEFDRLLRHFFFRDIAAERHGGGHPERAKFLYETPAEWVDANYRGFKNARRAMFFPD